MSPSQNIWHFPEEFTWIQTDHQHDVRNMKRSIKKSYLCSILRYCCVSVNESQAAVLVLTWRNSAAEWLIASGSSQMKMFCTNRQQGDNTSAEDLHGVRKTTIMWRLHNTWLCIKWRNMSRAFPYRGGRGSGYQWALGAETPWGKMKLLVLFFSFFLSEHLYEHVTVFYLAGSTWQSAFPHF